MCVSILKTYPFKPNKVFYWLFEDEIIVPLQTRHDLPGQGDEVNRFTHKDTQSCMKAIAKMDIDDSAIPIGVINAQVILEGHGQRCGPFITTGLAYSRPIEPLE